MSYLRNLLVAIDQGGNAWLGGNPDETISSRVGRAALAGKRWGLVAESIINWLFDDRMTETRLGHCRTYIEWDEL